MALIHTEDNWELPSDASPWAKQRCLLHSLHPWTLLYTQVIGLWMTKNCWAVSWDQFPLYSKLQFHTLLPCCASPVQNAFYRHVTRRMCTANPRPPAALDLRCWLDWGRSSPRGLPPYSASSVLRTSSSTSSRTHRGGTACWEAPMSTTAPTAWLLIWREKKKRTGGIKRK